MQMSVIGTFWCLFIIFIAFLQYNGTATNIMVGDKIVTQEEFNAMLYPKIFLLLFFLLGFSLFIYGIKTLIECYIFNKNAVQSYGLILSNEDSGKREWNADYPVYNIKILIMKDDNNFEVCVDNITSRLPVYPVGSLIILNYYKDKVDILGYTDRKDFPDELIDYVNNNYPEIEIR